MKKRPCIEILGTGRAVPERILTNQDLEKLVDTSDEWILARTGIQQRHIAEPGVPLSFFAAQAAQAALADAGASGEEIDLIILGTVTGDSKFPATACVVQDLIGAKSAAAFDVSAACSGFLYGLQLAESMMAMQGYRRILLIGGEILSSMVNWKDRDTCVLFGDGVGAVVLGPAQGSHGVLSTYIKSDGAFRDFLHSPGCGSLNPPSHENVDKMLHTIHMEGREVFRHAVTSMADALNQALDQAGVAVEELDLLIPHQANLRIIEAVGKRFRLSPDKIFVNVDRFGNTSAASIPIALDEARKAGRIASGSLVGMVTFGAGFTWAAAVIRL
ncbi:beta-ketoacyl-ACP synthase III [Desulfuromonas sp. AOP6]|uniref:beta-ketoacyl-ACP synthase III n=1 Tax=Desulfuromonas sp. AOP6 TaxID=1566351 RepID=UPI0012874E71|nr:beta-ketoacyl-ACP synthase III [Desulfuromonas sp. AOP6]BCA78322.1 3-oxoacyl-ACP synthase III [Desulfuromonas sp. AOP6]